MKLTINGIEASQAQEVTTLKGEKGILCGWTSPYKEGSTGRVHIKIGTVLKSFSPSVINAKFEKEDHTTTER